MSNFNKNGIINANETISSGGHIFSDITQSYSYTPGNNATNSCIVGQAIDLSEYENYSNDVVLRIRCTIEYSGTFAAGDGGTFNIRFQGSNYSLADSAFKWTGTNYITSALNSQKLLKTLVTSSASGIYQYDTVCTIPSSWFASYTKSYLGIRTDYSSGTGTIKISNIIIEPLKYSNGVSIHKNGVISAMDFIEY